MAGEDRAELIVVAGGSTAVAADGVERVIERIRTAQPGVAVVHHDLREMSHGVVMRRLRLNGMEHTTVLELAHGCVSCTLRGDILSWLRELGHRPDVCRIVLQLDPVLEPEPVCWTVLYVLVDGVPVTDAVELRGVITVLDVGTWLADAIGEQGLAQRRLVPLLDQDRTLGQRVIGQAEFADLLVYAGTAESGQLARTGAVLARLAPLALRLPLAELGRQVLLERLAPGARRGHPDDPHTALLRGQPPLHADAGVQLVTFTARRPFHPERLHRTFDVLLDGVVRIRGRVWLATRPAAVLWLEAAGGSLRLGHAGDWLAAGDADVWQHADPARRALASLHWHDRWGDRAQELVILIHDADPDKIEEVLREALLSDLELAAGESAWQHYPDPFGPWHTDPCDQITPQPMRGRGQEDQP